MVPDRYATTLKVASAFVLACVLYYVANVLWSNQVDWKRT
jgi:hypothetical protein